MKKEMEQTEWTRTDKFIPNERCKVVVFTDDGKSKSGEFICSNVWAIPGYPHELYNDDIMCWKLKGSAK